MSSATLSRPVFKQFRKGTRSCQECRRRKIKCKFLKEEDSICESCKKFDRDCVKQGYIVDKTLKARIIRAESTVERLGRYAKGTSARSTAQVYGQLSPSESSSSSSYEPSSHSTGSFLQLFNTKPLTNGHNKSTGPPLRFRTTVTFDDPGLTDREKLLSSIADEPLVMQVLETSGSWWTQWRDQGWTQRRTTASQTLTDITQTKLASEEPASIAIGLMCLAMSLFVFRPGIDDGGEAFISSSPKDLMHKILAVVDTIVLDTHKYDDAEDIVLLTMLRGKLYSEDSQARKGSQKLQQALRIMQTRKFGLVAQPGMTAEDVHSQQQFVGSVYEVERFMCMVFGFPYTPDPNFSDRLAFSVLKNDSGNLPLSLRMRAMRRVAAIAAERVTDRNAQKQSHDQRITDTIAQRLVVAHDALPTDWWEPELIAQSDDCFEAFEILLSQVWFWTTQMFLYLPAVLDSAASDTTMQPPTNNNDYYAQCLTAARNLIKAFEALRSTPAISVQVCNCDDFMGILAGSVLLVALMQAVSSGTLAIDSLETAMRFEQDMALIDVLKDIYRYRSFEQGGAIAKQGLKVLETLSSFFDENENDHDHLHLHSHPILPTEHTIDPAGHTIDPAGQHHDNEADTTAIQLPYFGTIYVQSSRKLFKPQFNARAHQALPTTPPPDFLFNGLIPDEKAFSMVDWDDWNQFMFDAELDQDWNYDLLAYHPMC